MENSIMGSTTFRIFVGLSAIPVVLLSIIYATDSKIFYRFVGNRNPIIVASIIYFLGILLMMYLHTNSGFAIYTPNNLTGLILACCLGILLAMVMSVFDTFVVLPENMNVAFPQSLLFYPAIGYMAEVVFHLLPLAILLFLLTPLFPDTGYERTIWFSIFLVALVEAVYQAMGLGGQYPVWVLMYVGCHLFVFNLAQLYLFKRYDFATMYSCRLAYYLIWHIVWGYFRLQFLF